MTTEPTRSREAAEALLRAWVDAYDGIDRDTLHSDVLAGLEAADAYLRLPDAGAGSEGLQGLTETVEYAAEVMRLLDEHEGRVVPHLLDTDDNPGQFLRDALPRAQRELVALARSGGETEAWGTCADCGHDHYRGDSGPACPTCDCTSLNIAAPPETDAGLREADKMRAPGDYVDEWQTRCSTCNRKVKGFCIYVEDRDGRAFDGGASVLASFLFCGPKCLKAYAESYDNDQPARTALHDEPAEGEG